MKNYKHTLKKVQSNLLQERQGGYEVPRCFFCYKPLQGQEGNFHTACNKRFFGQLTTPIIDYGYEELRDLASRVLQSQMAVTGVQPKLSLSFHKKKDKNPLKKMTIIGLYGDYILKPPSEHYNFLPEVEDLTMQLSNLCGINTVPHSLIKLTDGTVCYITKRIDRTRKEKLPMEDFCQLSERLTEDKYKGSYEQIAKLILKYSTNPYLDVTNFYEVVLLSYFTGNADMHLKNFSLWARDGKNHVLSPAYDLVNTALVNPADKEELALNLNGKKRHIKYHDFLKAFETSGLNEKILRKMLYNFYYCKHEMEQLIDNSFLNEEYKKGYKNTLDERFSLIPSTVYNG